MTSAAAVAVSDGGATSATLSLGPRPRGPAAQRPPAAEAAGGALASWLAVGGVVKAAGQPEDTTTA